VFFDRAPCSNFLFAYVRQDAATSRGRRAVDPVIIVVASAIYITMRLALSSLATLIERRGRRRRPECRGCGGRAG